MNIREELKHILIKKDTSMSKLVSQLNQNGLTIGSVQNFSNKLRNKTIRFNDVDKILDYLGYEIIIAEKNVK